MTVLVTGGAGYIGGHMVLLLLERGERVVVVDDLSKGFSWAVPPEARLLVADIGEGAAMEACLREHGVEAVIHFAGSVVVPDSVADPLRYYENNTAKSRTLIAACVRAGVSRFIFSSTAAVYGSPNGTAPVTEEAGLSPASPYGWSKLMTEIMLRDAAAAHDLSYAALRYFNVAGADPQGRAGQSTAGATHLVKVACETALGKRNALPLFGTDYPTPDGTCVRDYIHVADLVQAHALALNHLRAGKASLTANCGYGRGHSVREVIGAVERVTGRALPVTHAPRRPGDAPAIVADPAHLKATLGWQPQHADLDTIVADALQWEEQLERKNSARGMVAA